MSLALGGVCLVFPMGGREDSSEGTGKPQKITYCHVSALLVSLELHPIWSW
jgi:hypothetical protein